MPGVARSNNPPEYFTRSRRVGKKVRKDYIGPMSDPVVALLAREHRLRQAHKKAQRNRRYEERHEYDHIDRMIDQYGQQLDTILTSDAGDRNRDQSNATLPEENKAVMDYDSFTTLARGAELGSEHTAKELRHAMAGDAEQWIPLGDLTEHIKHIFLDLLTGTDPVAREALRLKTIELADKLNGKQPSIERKLATDQVVHCWLDLHYQQIMLATQNEGKSNSDFLERRVNKAHKRYLAALETSNHLTDTPAAT